MIHCLLCESSTLEESLLEHLQYNHMVYKKTLRNVLHSLHFPPVDQQLLDRLATECENEAAIAPTRNHNNLTPFATRRKRSVSKVHLDNFFRPQIKDLRRLRAAIRPNWALNQKTYPSALAR